MKPFASIICMLATAGMCFAAEEISREIPLGVSQPAIDMAVERGLAYIAANQNRDGSWGDGSGRYSRHVGIAGIANLALMANGNVPGRGRYGKNVDDGLRFILRHTSDHSGYISNQDSRMYGHGFATLSLAEAYGMTANPDLKYKLRLAVRCIVRTQHPDGGWRYEPSPQGDSDLSVTICQVQALRAARNAGIKVPKETIDRAVKYTKDSAQTGGQFSYMLRGGGGGSYALAAAGVTALCGMGEYDAPEVLRGIEYLRGRAGGRSGHYFYGQYYASQAFYQVGGEAWEEYFQKIVPHLLSEQREDGSWSGNVGGVYSTAMACLVLQVHNGYLPIFQR